MDEDMHEAFMLLMDLHEVICERIKNLDERVAKLEKGVIRENPPLEAGHYGMGVNGAISRG